MITPRRFEKLGEETQNINGRPVYTGKVHEYLDDNELEFGKAIKLLLILAAAALLPAAAAGCLRVPGMINTWWVIIPYGAYVLTAASMLWGSLRLLVNEKPLKDSVYKHTAFVLPPRSGAHVIFSGILLAVYAINFAVNGLGNFNPLESILFPVCVICSAIAAHFTYKTAKMMHWS